MGRKKKPIERLGFTEAQARLLLNMGDDEYTLVAYPAIEGCGSGYRWSYRLGAKMGKRCPYPATIDKLTEAGLIERRTDGPSDYLGVPVRLTEAGKVVAAELARIEEMNGLRYCPINARNAEGVILGRCWHELDECFCPWHGDVSVAVGRFLDTGELTLPEDN